MKSKFAFYENTHNIDVSIIIVNYKSWNHLTQCLLSLKHIDGVDFSFEIIIIDNQSNDGLFERFKKKFPEFTFILNSGNFGFSHANNLGVKYASGTYLLFLNPDTIVTKSAILTLMQLAIANTDYGIISCSKVKTDGNLEKEIRLFPKLHRLFGVFRFLDDVILKPKRLKLYHPDKSIIFPDWVSGSIIFMSKQWYNKVNGWNEDYWLYLEDVDLCKKITDVNGKVVLTRTAQIIHNHGGASRLNIITAALTKAEVVISKHVYINTHFSTITKYMAHFALIFFGIISSFIFAIIGLLFFFIPKLSVHSLLFVNLIKYYCNCLFTKTWLSKRAPAYTN